MGVNLLDVEGRGACIVDGNLEVKSDGLLKKSSERRDHGLK